MMCARKNRNTSQVAGWDERGPIKPTAISFINTFSSQKSQVKQQSLTPRGLDIGPQDVELRGVGWGIN